MSVCIVAGVTLVTTIPAGAAALEAGRMLRRL